MRIVDSPGDGTFTAVYALTPNGAKLTAELRKADLSAKEAPGGSPRAAGLLDRYEAASRGVVEAVSELQAIDAE